MDRPGKALPAERVPHALAAIAAWRANPDAPTGCPVCGSARLAIVDRSARPYAEWYALSCMDCGLDHNLHVPLAAPRPPDD